MMFALVILCARWWLTIVCKISYEFAGSQEIVKIQMR